MPKYEYACRSCGEHVEVVQSFADDPLAECPACAGPLRKVFSAPSIAFKGSGFYRTDNRKRRTEPSPDTKTDKSTADAKTESTPSAGGESKSESVKADATPKTEPKTEPKPKAAEAKSA